jgi:DNA repair exonuclease SbcCD ATPase subunit
MPQTEKERQIQELTEKIAGLTAEIERRKQAAAEARQKQTEQLATAASGSNKRKQTQTQQKQPTQPVVTPEKDPKIKELEKMIADLNTQVRTYAQNQQAQTSTYEQRQRELTATISAKDRRIQELERNIAMLNTQTAQESTAQRQGRSSSTKSRTSTAQSSSSTSSNARNQSMIFQRNVSSGYYIVFGSFIERNNAEKFLAKLRNRYTNVVDLGNDNIFGMYRTGIGPYRTKEEAVAQRPTEAKNWVLRVETVPNTKLIAYFEILDE